MQVDNRAGYLIPGALAVDPCTTLSHSCRLNGWLSVTAAITALAGSSQGQNGCWLGGDPGHRAANRDVCEGTEHFQF